jgi:hypothetical protein
VQVYTRVAVWGRTRLFVSPVRCLRPLQVEHLREHLQVEQEHLQVLGPLRERLQELQVEHPQESEEQGARR